MAKSVINKINTGSAEYNIASTAYCTCATAAATVAKVAYVQGDDASATTGFTLVQGVTVHVKFTYSNTATNPTLSINGSTAKQIMRYGTTVVGETVAASWRAGAIVSITYDGDNWVLNSSIDDNSTYTIPTVNNATLTIQKNSSTVATFTANSSTNTTANITVPTKVSELTNDAGYKTTDNNTTYTIATGDSNGQIKVTPSVGDAYNVSVKGLGSAAYTNSSAYAAASHGTHVTFGGNGSATTVSRSDHTHSGYVSSAELGEFADDVANTYAAKSHTHDYAASDHTHSGYVSSATFDEFTEYAEGNYLTDHQTIKQDGVTGATANHYGSCTTAAATAAKTVSLTAGTFNLEAGARIIVKFTNKNTASNPTLDVASKGAKNIYYNGARITTGANKGMLYGACEFIFDGTQFHLVSPAITYETIGAAASGHGHSGYCTVLECGTYPELGALKYDVSDDCYENCFIKGILGSNYFWGFVQSLDSGYFVHLWSNDAIYRLTYNGSAGTWTDDIRYYAQSNKLPSFSLSGTVLTITDNN